MDNEAPPHFTDRSTQKMRWGVTALVVGNALLLPMWNGSLTFSYFALSVLFAPASALLMMIRKD